ncbi:hypothetical protein NC653_022086 [Populus alba x Populus x berolinensis]|uniref:Uncharacterized protein n=1 Tax=Populus alba x Populus x berolinensis TaxID=444605 RepID=A0AAD6QFF6_9ROSI|nr:hypothetical protein NC653_022086 [Populus alba x Populus x berolinensis]
MHRELAVRGREGAMQRGWFARDAASVGWAIDAREETHGCCCTTAGAFLASSRDFGEEHDRERVTGCEERAFYFLQGATLGSSRFFFLSFLSFCNLLGVSCASFSPPLFTYIEIYIYSARVSLRVETKFQSNSFSFFKFEFD